MERIQITKDATFPVVLLKKYSRFFQDLVTENPEAKIEEIELPTVLKGYQSQTFVCLEIFLQDSKNYDGERDDILRLAISLDMPRAICEIVVSNDAHFFACHIMKNNIFTECLEYYPPYKLFKKLLSINTIQSRYFTYGKTLDIVEKEKALGGPSKQILYVVYRSSISITQVIIKKVKYAPIPVPIDDMSIPQLTTDDVNNWFLENKLNKLFRRIGSIVVPTAKGFMRVNSLSNHVYSSRDIVSSKFLSSYYVLQDVEKVPFLYHEAKKEFLLTRNNDDDD